MLSVLLFVIMIVFVGAKEGNNYLFGYHNRENPFTESVNSLVKTVFGTFPP